MGPVTPSLASVAAASSAAPAAVVAAAGSGARCGVAASAAATAAAAADERASLRLRNESIRERTLLLPLVLALLLVLGPAEIDGLGVDVDARVDAIDELHLVADASCASRGGQDRRRRRRVENPNVYTPLTLWKFKFVLYTLASVVRERQGIFCACFQTRLHPIKTMARLAALLFLMLAASALSQKVLVLTDDTLADALSSNDKIMVEFYGASSAQRVLPKLCVHVTASSD